LVTDYSDAQYPTLNKDHSGFLTAWLKDAYGMEKALIPVLENHAKDAKDHPQLQAKIQQHLNATQQHADMVQQCLDRFGESPSSVKSALGSLFGNVQSVGTGAAEDELVKNGLQDFAAENFEIASYKALIAAAQQVGANDVAQVCEHILKDEEDMAHFLEQNLPIVLHQAMSRKQDKQINK
jgi:ferritin-like metal-binding protein YciE